MKFRVRLFAAVTFLCSIALIAAVSPTAGQAREKKQAAGVAAADQPYKAIPKPDNRRPGELEGWDDSKKAAPPAAKSKTKSVSSKKKAKAAKAEEPASDGATPNGGLPLPSGHGNVGPESGVGFDKNGNFGTGLKF